MAAEWILMYIDVENGIIPMLHLISNPILGYEEGNSITWKIKSINETYCGNENYIYLINRLQNSSFIEKKIHYDLPYW